MGWRDRDYARWSEDERRRFLESASTEGRGRSGRIRVIGAAAAVSAIVALALGQFPHGHPIISALQIRRSSSVRRESAPVRRPTTVQISGPKKVPLHAVVTFRGGVPPADQGPIRILGSLNNGAWRTLAVADGSSGSYLARIRVNSAGRLRIRILFRDGTLAVETIQVG